MQDIKITKLTFRKCEAEWFNYYKTVQEIKTLEKSIIDPYKEKDENIGGGQSNVPGDPTEATALRLTKNKQLNYLKEIVDAIEYVYESRPEEHKKLVRVRYWSNKRMNWNGVASEIGYSRRTVIRW